jgi:outer membrane protein assembly factor BamE (lipoprotein component of BamABCDE complex)
MKRLVPLFSALFITLVLAGCGSSGKNFPVGHVGEIQNGVTTQSQILDWFGVPFKEGVRNGNPLWTYQFDTYNSLGIGKDNSKELTILFDENNFVKAYRYASNMD